MAEEKAQEEAPKPSKPTPAKKASAAKKTTKKTTKKAAKKTTKKKTTKKAAKKKAAKKTTKKKAAKKPAAKPAKKRVKLKPTALVRMPTATDVLRQLRTTTKDESDYAMFADPLAHVAPVTEWMPSGMLGIDKLTATAEHGGGWPVGRIIEISAGEGVGKSTMLDQSMAMCQRMGGVACLLDTERSRDTLYMEQLGVDLDSLIVANGDTTEEAFAVIESMIEVQENNMQALLASKRRPPPMVIVWDSVGGTPTQAEVDAASEDAQVASAAKVIRRNMRRLASRIADARVVLLLANQLYAGIGMYTANQHAYGGGGIRYAAALRLWLARGDGIKKGESYIGHEIKVKMKKTRVCSPQPPSRLGLIYGAGVHNAWTLFDWGKLKSGPSPEGGDKDQRWVTQRGAVYDLFDPADPSNPIKFKNQSLGLAEVFGERADIYQQMATHYLYGAA